MKILPVTAGLFYADGRTDMTVQIVVFRNFVKGLTTVIPASAHSSLEDRFLYIYPIRGIRNVTHSLT